MQFGDDERAAAIQVGAVLLFGILVISMATYQATVVPDQNEGVEFNHNQKVQGQMQDLRNSVVSVPSGGGGGSVTVDLGTTYPSRSLFVNPGPPYGSLRTVGTNDGDVNVSIENARPVNEQTRHFWNETDPHFDTGSIVYRPNYHEYVNPPTTVYEHTLLYNQFRSANLTITDQDFVDGTEITVITLDGNLSENGMRAASVTADPVSASTNTVSINSSSGDPINLTVATRLEQDVWNETLSEERADDIVLSTDYNPDGPGEYALLTISLNESKTYDLRMAKVGVGSGASDPTDELYLADPTLQGTTASAEVRDRYNNPVSGTNVTVYVDGTETATKESGSDGRVNYDANSGDTVKFSIGRSEADNVTITVPSSGGSTGGDGSAYSIDWQDPETNSSNDGLNLTDCTDEQCTWDVGASDDDVMALTGIANDEIDNVDVDFRVNNSTVATVDPSSTTDTGDGRVWTNLTAAENGTVGVYVLSSGSSDRIDVAIENVTGSAGAPTANFTYSCSGRDCVFNSTATDDGIIQGYEWDFDGDGTVDETGENVSHTYDTGGTYDVTHTVMDDDGLTDSVTRQVSVTGQVTINADATGSSGSGGPSTNSIVTFSISNNRGGAVDVTDLTVNSTSNRQVVELENSAVSGSDGEVEVDVGETGSVNAVANATSYSIGTTMTLSSAATVSSGTNASVQLTEFDQDGADNSVNPRDMSGETITVTVHYTYDGQSYAVSKTLTVS